MESLFYGMFGPIGALAAILELTEYVEPSIFWQVESSPNKGQKKVTVYTVSNLYVKHLCSYLVVLIRVGGTAILRRRRQVQITAECGRVFWRVPFDHHRLART